MMWKFLVLLLAANYCKANELKCIFQNFTMNGYHSFPETFVTFGCKAIELPARAITGSSFLVELKDSTSFQRRYTSYVSMFEISTHTFNLPSGLAFVLQNLVYYRAVQKHIKHLSRANFEGLSQLKLLGLQGNEIEEIPARVFDDLENLIHVNLEYNKIKSIASDVVNGLKHLKVIFLYRNPCSNDTFYAEFHELSSKMNALSENQCHDENMHTDIVGGVDQPINEIPFAAQIFRLHNFHCTGSIVTKNFILTAAHCFDDMPPIENWLFTVGSSYLFGGSQYPVDKVIGHYAYSKIWTEDRKSMLYLKNDLALMKSKYEIEFGPYVQPVILNEGLQYGEDGTCKIVGWGRTSPNGKHPELLQSAAVVLIENCAEAWPRAPTSAVDYRNICTTSRETTPKGACYGDSGGMVLAYSNKNLIQIGVISWGGPECDNRVHPDVHVRVSSYIDWIKETLEDESHDMIP